MGILRIAERKWRFAALQRSGMNAEKALVLLSWQTAKYPLQDELCLVSAAGEGADPEEEGDREQRTLLVGIREPPQPSGEQGGVPR